VSKDFEKLRQLILVEEFKACVPTSIKMYIDEQKAGTLHQAAVLADDYSLTHRSAFVPTGSSGSASNKDDRSTTLYLVIPKCCLVSITINMIMIGMLIGLSQLFATIVSAEVMLWKNVGHYSRRSLMYLFVLE